MCILTGRVSRVAGTKLFVSELSGSFRATIYEMEIAADEPVAMVLPVPTDHEIVFVDLSDYRDIFDDIAKSFPEPFRSRGLTKGAHKSKSLEVHRVGDYIASFVPSLDRFEDLDEQFRLPESVIARTEYGADFGFAVFQFRDIAKPVKMQPMAYKYVANNSRELFFPTTHVHDGKTLSRHAEFDHVLYHQQSDRFDSQWEVGNKIEDRQFDWYKTGDMISTRRFQRRIIEGRFPNRDVVVHAS